MAYDVTKVLNELVFRVIECPLLVLLWADICHVASNSLYSH